MGRYRSMSGSWIDPEKQQLYRDFDESDDTSTLSPAALDPYAPILAQNGRPAKYAYHLPRRRFGRYFTFSISACLLLFIFYLVRSSWVSQAELLAGLHKKPPPPHAWEQFPFLKRYHGGIRTLVARSENKPEYPVDEEQEAERLRENAEAQKQQADEDAVGQKGLPKRDQTQPQSQRFDPWSAEKPSSNSTEDLSPLPCYLDEDTKSIIPQLLAYKGVPSGFPDPVIGSHDLLGLRADVCFERYGRLGPYGFGYSQKFGGTGTGMEGEREGSEEVWGDDLEIDYRKVRWAAAQERCAKKNAKRFRVNTKQALNHFSMPSGSAVAELESRDDRKSVGDELIEEVHGRRLNRTAVLIRTWLGYEYDAEDIFYLRALVNELSLQSGSEFIVHFLVHVKEDADTEIWSDEATYQQVLHDALPAEFRGMGTLWSEKQMALVYSGVAQNLFRDLPVHGVYRSTFMPVQYFAHTHPEYAFFWNWEMDTRYTGHFAHLFRQVSQWAQQQPRKGLWERNGRFYIPAEHGSWDDFRQLVRVQTEHGTASKQNIYGKLSTDASADSPLSKERRLEAPIWGPATFEDDEESTVVSEFDQRPLVSYEKDKYDWGVGEEADLITFNPLFDPQDTNWLLADDVTGYNTTEDIPPRRVSIITASRLSYRLLETMHRETSVKHHTMFSEMWPASCALHHGFKAVYAPHPVYIDRAWPTSYLAAIFNNGRNGAAGGARTSIFSDERQHNFRGTTWYYNSGFGPNLWKRWLGYKVDNDGGEEWEMANEGRMCLPAMLLHPVKHVDMIYEHEEGETGLY